MRRTLHLGAFTFHHNQGIHHMTVRVGINGFGRIG
ncbi:MAG: hypothetical protein ACI8RC_002671, partial [Ilumatobacter sp.]